MADAADAGSPDHGPEVIRWIHPPDLPGTELLWVENSGRMWRWFHDTYSVCSLFTGSSEWTYRRAHLRTDAGRIMAMEPGEVHVTLRLPGGPCSFKMLLLTPEVLERAAREHGLSRPPHVGRANIEHPEVLRAFAEFHRCIERSPTALERDSRLARCLRALLVHCAERSAPLSPRSDRVAVERARDFLHDHYADSVRLDALAAVAGLSRIHLLRAFAATVGLPPHAYQIRLRVERARALLAAGQPIAETATAVGFADQSHLGRHFTRVVGVTPGAYVRAVHPFRVRDGAPRR